ncbi:hypothetical protein Trydic_g12519 [Trypoxylus dichotomus]
MVLWSVIAYYCSCLVLNEDELLIRYVRQYPALYDPRHPDYKNQETRDELWDKIAGNIGKKALDCKKRWRSIRDTFFRSQRQYKRQVVTGRRLKRPTWSLLEHLTFLNNFGSHKRHGNCSQLDPKLAATFTEHIRDSSIKRRLPSELRKTESNSTISKNRSQDLDADDTSRRKKLDDDYDPVLTFFRSMALMVKNFEPEMIAEAKSKVFGVVMELEQRSLREKDDAYYVKVEPTYTARTEDGCITPEETKVIVPDVQE